MRKKIDNRLRVLIENGVNLGHRSLFVIVGEQARDQVVILHHILANAQIKARPSVLWCYSKELGFTTHRRKRQRLQQNKLKAGVNVNEDDPFELFIASTTIRWCYYNESQKILGNTYGMLVLQDFEAITPNLLARTIETIEGGGIVVLLLNTLTSLKQLYTMSMDVHDRYRTEAHQDVVSRFNERFILALASCKSCVVLDDKLTVLPISSHVAEIDPIPKTNELSAEALQLRDLAQSLSDVQPAGSLVSCCKTLDQAKVVLKFIDALSEKTLKSTVSLTAARGRGKSAALGLAIAAAIGFNYSNIYVTSPSPENLKTLFDFILKGFEAIKLQEHLDYEVVHSSNTEFNKAVIRINVFRDHRQTIQYIHPSEVQKGKVLGSSSELVVIDEAAAIPLPIVKSLFGPYLVFLASTINGYEGTGRSLSLKLLKQLRQQSALSSSANSKELNNRILHEITLNESIRYKAGDQVEMWLNSLLCLDAELAPKNSASGCPVPEECELYFINRDTLFSFHKASESFLQKLMALYVASHYKNSPNDLQMMSDAPAHQLFCLLSPLSEAAKAKGKLPEVLCFIQVCLEGQISKDSIMNSLSRGKRASGDLIPWTVSQQFQDNQFASLSGARVVRIATNPNYQGMGYGTMALKLLEDYYKGHFNDIEDSAKLEKSDESDDDDEKGEGDIAPKKSLPPLLSKLSERNAERLDYMGVSFGLTGELFRFWKKNGYVPVYMRQTPNELTGEHSCIVLKMLADDKSETDANEWLVDFFLDFQKRFISLLGYQFSSMSSAVALNILAPNMKIKPEKISRLTKHELDVFISLYDLRRLEMYSQNMVDYHLIVDLLPAVSRLYFLKKFGDEVTLSAAQAAILLSIGLQHKQIEIIEEEMQLPVSQILGLFNRGMRKLSKFMKGIEESAVEESLDMPKPVKINMKPVAQSLEDELEDGAVKVQREEKAQFKQLNQDLKHLSHFAVKGNEDDWDKALHKRNKTLVSIKTIEPKRKVQDEEAEPDKKKFAKKKKFSNKKHGKK